MGTWIRLTMAHDIIEWDSLLYLLDGQGNVLVSGDSLIMRVGKRRFVRIVLGGVNTQGHWIKE